MQSFALDGYEILVKKETIKYLRKQMANEPVVNHVQLNGWQLQAPSWQGHQMATLSAATPFNANTSRKGIVYLNATGMVVTER